MTENFDLKREINALLTEEVKEFIKEEWDEILRRTPFLKRRNHWDDPRQQSKMDEYGC